MLEFVHEISASSVHGLYITEKLEPTLLQNEASATVFNFQNLLQSQLIHVDVQDDANIADHANDEAKEEDEEQQVDEEEDVNVDGEDDDEERLQFIDSDDEQTYEEQDKQKRAEDDKWFDRHVVDEAV
ncbi:unnamed protein product, partial [Prunus brigantina]